MATAEGKAQEGIIANPSPTPEPITDKVLKEHQNEHKSNPSATPSSDVPNPNAQKQRTKGDTEPTPSTIEFTDPYAEIKKAEKEIQAAGGKLTPEARKDMDQAVKEADSLPKEKIDQELEEQKGKMKSVLDTGNALYGDGKTEIGKLPPAQKEKFISLIGQLSGAKTDAERNNIIQQMQAISGTATDDVTKLNNLTVLNKDGLQRLQMLENLDNASVETRLSYSDMLIDRGDKSDKQKISSLEKEALDLAPPEKKWKVQQVIDIFNKEQQESK